MIQFLSSCHFLSGNYSIIYADPPWHFRVWHNETGPGRSADKHYKTMPLEEIKALPVQALAAPDCCLFMWATYPMLPEALEVVTAWGFAYKTVAFTWVKLNPSGVGFHFGLGYWTRGNPEICLLATRGHPKRIDNSVPNLVIAERRNHSRKPDEIRNRIIRLVGDLPRVELFARQVTPGWDVWGDEVESNITIDNALALSCQM